MLAYYPAYLLTLDVISDISDILSGIPSEILSGVSSDILSGKLNAYLLTCDYGTLPASQRQRRRTRRRRRRSKAADIKSNNPHLTGGELKACVRSLECWTAGARETAFMFVTRKHYL